MTACRWLHDAGVSQLSAPLTDGRRSSTSETEEAKWAARASAGPTNAGSKQVPNPQTERPARH